MYTDRRISIILDLSNCVEYLEGSIILSAITQKWPTLCLHHYCNENSIHVYLYDVHFTIKRSVVIFNYLKNESSIKCHYY